MDTDSSPSPNKRQKTLTLTSSSPSSKGKEKIIAEGEEESTEEDEDKNICGICFTEEDEKSVRGWIDSCHHFFCFVCIMEWSKVESRCPFCKQRFQTICRKPKDGVFLRERIVSVPERNQVWHPLGNQTTEFSDPYAQVNCTECQTTHDDHLLLLCDLCDSAAHTYCVGLGATVPEGDWYCHDCTLSRNEHTGTDIDTDPQESGNFVTTTAAAINVSISASATNVTISPPATVDFISEAAQNDVVSRYFRESCSRNVPSLGRASRRPNHISSRMRDRRTSSKVRMMEPSASRGHQSSHMPDNDISSRSKVTDSSARTLSHCRNVRNCIQFLRENWDDLRNGSVRFSTNATNSDGKNNRKHERSATCDKSSKSQSSSSGSRKQNTIKDNASGDRINDKGPYDIDKAWKMLDIAKSVQSAHECPRNNHQTGKQIALKAVQRARECNKNSDKVSNHQTGKQDVSKEVNNTRSIFSTSRSKKIQIKDPGGLVLEKNYRYQSLEVARPKCKSQNSEERVPSKGALENSCGQRTPKTNPSRSCGFQLAKQAPIVDQGVLCRESSFGEKRDHSKFNGKSGKASNVFSDRSVLCASSCSKEEPSKEGGMEKNCAKTLGKEDEDAKCEVQSLVKLNLKLLSRDKQLGVNGFKEVARLATHTILAACGLEHKESNVRPFSGSICRHNNVQTKQLNMSNLMPTSCRECFYGFVKDVVSSIMAEETALVQQDVKQQKEGLVFI